MSTRDKNGCLHSDKNGRFTNDGNSDAAKLEELKRIYNSDGENLKGILEITRIEYKYNLSVTTE